MCKIFKGILIAIFAIISLGASASSESQTEPLKTKISLDINNPVGITTTTVPVEKINLVFTKNSISPISTPNHQIVQITPGDSNFTILEKQKKEQEEQKRIILATRVKNTEKSVKVIPKGNFDELYKAAGARYGIPWQILAAVHSVESGQSGDTSRTNRSGATGPMQFLPSTFRAYAVDGDGDGVANIHGVVDSVYSAARYLAANLARKGSLEGALWCYNHSYSYVNKVLAIARSVGF